MQDIKQKEILTKLNKIYEKFPFSIGLHTTNNENAKQICEDGLKTGARALEGTIKFRGDLKNIVEKDLDYFFPYTNHTVIIAVPTCFKTSRIEDNKGGYEPLCGFSRFFERAQNILSNYSKDCEGLLPSYYILGYYDKNYNLIFNKKCLLLDKESEEKFKKDIKEYKNSPLYELNIE